jgi:hypothetical protein
MEVTYAEVSHVSPLQIAGLFYLAGSVGVFESNKRHISRNARDEAFNELSMPAMSKPPKLRLVCATVAPGAARALSKRILI